MPKTQTARRPSEVADALQASLVDLIALSLQTKQAHWNVMGPGFRPLHELFDEMTDAIRGWYDDVAERCLALGVPADGRSMTVAENAEIRDLPAGRIADREAVSLILERVQGLVGRLRDKLNVLGEQDVVTQDLIIGIIQGLEKQAWMLRAHQS